MFSDEGIKGTIRNRITEGRKTSQHAFFKQHTNRGTFILIFTPK